MTGFVWSLLRCWGFFLTAPLAVVLGLLGGYAGSASAAIPTLRLPIPVPTLLPVVVVLVLSWTVHDRWSTVTAAAVRPRWQLAVTRFLVTTVVCCTAVAIGTLGHGYSEPVAVTAIGTSLVAVAAVAIGRRTWILILIGGYLWLRYAVWQTVGAVVPHDRATAAAAVVSAAAILATTTAVHDS